MARGALLWLLGVPIPIIILLFLFWRKPCRALRSSRIRATSDTFASV